MYIYGRRRGRIFVICWEVENRKRGGVGVYMSLDTVGWDQISSTSLHFLKS